MLYKKISKKFRQLLFVKNIIKYKSIFFVKLLTSINIYYIQHVQRFSNLNTTKENVGMGAGLHISASRNNKKFFFKVINRKNSKKNELTGYSKYNKGISHSIVVHSYNYFPPVNYICFEFTKFLTLKEFIKINVDNINFTNDLIFIAKRLYDTKVNHNDISLLNIAVIKSKEKFSLELFDFGCAKFNDKNFNKFFTKDCANIKHIAKQVLSLRDYNKFLTHSHFFFDN